jgi:DNA polymerase (family 10)
MNNYAVARVFSRIADLMEIKGENVHKIRAYRTAAQTMQELTESLEVLAERGELQSIPGVGEAIAAKTRDILATGATKLYDGLKAEVPESLVELLGIPGFGVKKIRSVWQELGVRTLADLEQAAGEHRLRTIPGFSDKTEANVLEAVAAARKRRDRTPIGVALPYAEGLARLLRATGKFERLEIVGSLRRRKDTLGDIDLLGASSDPEGALEALLASGEVGEVLERGEHGLTVLTQDRLRLDLCVVSPEAFPAELQRRTGSEAHTARLGALAVEKGVSLPARVTDEEEVYRSLGLPWIPPELREGQGEIEAARDGRLPRLIEERDYRGVLHAHTTWSDGAVSVERMALAARDLGHSYLAITDHSQALTIAGGLDEARLLAQMAEIDGVNAKLAGFRVLRGIECDIMGDGSLDLPCELLERLDFVIGSVHSHQRQDEETMTRRIVRALESGVLDLLAHPTGRILGVRDPYGVDMERVMDAALANGVAMEINAYPDRLDLNEGYARRAKDRGIPISVNPDAHRPEHLGLLRYGIGQARRAWLEAEEVINTWPLDRLTRWLAERT